MRNKGSNIQVVDAYENNLKHINVSIPKGKLVVFAGVSGSGKSSLVFDTIVIDQKPIGTSIRSTPATYIGIMDEIRNIFAKENGVKPSLFSFNSDGACPVCKGTGQISYDMAFAEPVVVPCEECGGHRYNHTALVYRYKNLNIEDVLNLTVEQALKIFDNDKIRTVLQSMIEVGLEYLTLGQPTATLSGGELQRIKLISELNKSGNVYVLDEPSNGLSAKDVGKLLDLLQRLISKGNTVIIIEHRLELIAKSDWIIDIGPDGGTGGGEILFTGTPKQLLQCDNSKTAHYLRRLYTQ